MGLNKIKNWCLAFVLGGLLVAPAAQANKLITQDSFGYIYLPSVNEAAKRIGSLVDKFQPGMGGMAPMMISQGLAQGLNSQGIDLSKPVVILFLNNEDLEQPVVTLFSVADAEEVLKNESQLEPGRVLEVAKHVAAIGTAEAVDMVKGRLKLLDDLQVIKTSSDVVIRFDIQMLKKHFGDEIKQSVETGVKGKQAQGVQDENTKQMQEAGLELLKELGRQATHAQLGLRIGEDALSLGYRMDAQEGTVLHDFTSAKHPPRGELLKMLPTDVAAIGVSDYAVNQESLGKLINHFADLFLEGDVLEAEDKEALRGMLNLYQANGAQLFSTSDKGFITYSLQDVENPENYVSSAIENFEAYFKMISGVSGANSGSGDASQMMFDVEKMDDREFDGINIKRMSTVITGIDTNAILASPSNISELAVVAGKVISVGGIAADPAKGMNKFIENLKTGAGGAKENSAMDSLTSKFKASAQISGAISLMQYYKMIGLFMPKDGAGSPFGNVDWDSLVENDAPIVVNGFFTGGKAAMTLDIPVDPIIAAIKGFQQAAMSSMMAPGMTGEEDKAPEPAMPIPAGAR